MRSRTLVSFISLTGVAYPVGNVMPDLPLRDLSFCSKPCHHADTTLDLFSRGTDPESQHFNRSVRSTFKLSRDPGLKMKKNSEAYDVAALQLAFRNWNRKSRWLISWDSMPAQVTSSSTSGIETSGVFVMM